MSEPAPAEAPRARLEVRVGSATNALQPIPGASRSLAAGSVQWIGLGLVAVAAAGADQLTKAFVSSRLALGHAVEVVGPFTIHHVRNTGIAFGLFSNATSVVIVLTGVAIGSARWCSSRAPAGGTRSCPRRSGSCWAVAHRTSSTASASVT